MPLPFSPRTTRFALAALALALMPAANAGNLADLNEIQGQAGAGDYAGWFGAQLTRVGDDIFASSPMHAQGGQLEGSFSRLRRQSSGQFQIAAGETYDAPLGTDAMLGEAMTSASDRLYVSQLSNNGANHQVRIYNVVASGIGLDDTVNLASTGAQGTSTHMSLAASGVWLAAARVANNQNAGSVSILERAFARPDGGGPLWSVRTSILAPINVPGAAFGHAMAMTGDTLFVGMPSYNNLNAMVFPGRVYQFQRPNVGSNWPQVAQLPLPPGLPQEQPARMGWSMDVRNGILAIGAPRLRETETGPEIGAVIVYELDGNQWTYRATVLSPEPVDGAEFGYAVSIHDQDLLIGAPGVAGERGRAYVYRRQGTNSWVATRRLIRTSTLASRFGEAVLFNNDTEYLGGAPQFGTQAIAQGAFYRFREELLRDGFE
ncbi:MAG: hypothetical protein KDI37_14525 [Xanthomonadales bacterium]|nr:hypothetical protein [Xanthomonadales bacterium]